LLKLEESFGAWVDFELGFLPDCQWERKEGFFWGFCGVALGISFSLETLDLSLVKLGADLGVVEIGFFSSLDKYLAFLWH
jgi:hypothetical protein